MIQESDPDANKIAKVSWRVPAIDGVRALAMLMVYTFHVWQFSGSPLGSITVSGHRLNLLGTFATFPAGVDLFMVLSGFCLFLPLCKSDAALKHWNIENYFLRRVRRIVPPYYAAIVYSTLLPAVLVVVFRLLGQEARWQPVPSWWQFLTHFLFIHTFFRETWDGINGVFWSLGLEAQFYLVFPLAIFGFRRIGTRFFWFMVGASIFYRITVTWFLPASTDGTTSFLFSIFFLGRWMQFALGMVAAWTVARHWNSNLRLDAVIGSLAIVAALGIYALAVSDFIAKVTVLPLRDLLLALCFGGGITALCITRTPIRWFFENRVMAGIGFISYSFFLIHQPTAYYLSVLMTRKLHVQGAGLFVLLCPVGFLLVLAIALLFFLIFERPFLNYAAPKKPLVAEPIIPFDGQQTGIVQDQAAP